MRDVDLFQQALGLQEPWRVATSTFDAGERRLDLRIEFSKGARFACADCGRSGCPVHDSTEKTWRHLDFFQHEAYLTAKVPRVRCDEHGVHLVQVPWARPGSGFTLLFEALVMALVSEMPVNAVAELIGEHDTRVWRILHHYVDAAHAAQDVSLVKRLGVDETSNKRGQDYVTVFADLDGLGAIYATPGRGADTYKQFACDLKARGGQPSQIAELCQDMSESFLTGARTHLPDAEITFDRYHVKAQLTRAVDAVRRAEAVEHHDVLRRTRYLWLRSPNTLSINQMRQLDELLRLPLRTGRAYQWMLKFDELYRIDDPDRAEQFLRRWLKGVKRSRLAPLIDFARMIDNHLLGVLRWWHTKISNGLLEGLNSLIQAAKRRARGYRSTRNYIAIIYLVAGHLQLPTHTN